MTTDYDPIARQYKRSKLQPWRTHIESYALMALVGNLSGKTVVDVACGDGYYTRLLRACGASKVRGVDLSERMVELARAQKAERPLYLDDGPFFIENYHLDVVTHEDELRSAGFREVRWHAPRLSPEGESISGREFWATFLDHSPITFIEYVK